MIRAGTIVIAMIGLFVLGCSSSTPIIDDPATTNTTVEGTLDITGSQLADLTDASEVGDQDAEKFTVRLIDPTEDLDLTTLINDDVSFSGEEIAYSGDYVLEIDLLPAADLAGGAAEFTPVTVDIPIVLVENEATVVNVEVEFIAPDAVTAVHTTSQPGGAYRIQLRYQLQGAQTGSEFMELNWGDQVLRRDSNADGSLENEPEFADANRDFISNGLAEQFQQMPHSSPHELHGTLEAIHLEAGWIQVAGARLEVNEMTLVMNGMSHLRLNDLEVGQHVRVSGQQGQNDRHYAQEIIITGPASY